MFSATSGSRSAAHPITTITRHPFIKFYRRECYTMCKKRHDPSSAEKARYEQAWARAPSRQTGHREMHRRESQHTGVKQGAGAGEPERLFNPEECEYSNPDQTRASSSCTVQGASFHAFIYGKCPSPW